MNADLLLDTCAAIWMTGDAPMHQGALDAIAVSTDADRPLFVSPITAWEVAVQMSKGRVTVPMPARRWFERLAGVPGVLVCEMPPSLLIDSTELPGKPPPDPADRIIIATAREFGLRIVTRDRLILSYAAQGHVLAVAC